MARVSASLLAAGIAAAVVFPSVPAYAAPAPPPVTGLTAKPADSQVSLSWTNPADADFAGVTVVQKTGETAPSSVGDGTTRYQGTANRTTVTGLTNGTKYSFAVFARNAEGAVSDPATASAAPVPAVATRLTATLAPGVVTYGAGVTIKATLKRADTGAGVPNAPVDFYRKVAGQSSFAKLGRRYTDAAGVLTYVPAAPTANMQWYLAHPATPFLAASKSAPLTSLVRPRLGVRVSAYAVEQNVPSVVTVSVTPSHAGQAMLLQLWTSTGWRNVASRTINSYSVARFDIATSTIGKRVFRLAKAADADHAAAVTTSFGITTVRRSLRAGMSGGDVTYVQKRLAALRYDVGTINGYYGYDTVHATTAFQKVHGLPRTGVVDARTYERLLRPATPRLRYAHGGSWVEADLTKQVLYYVTNGSVQRILDISSGNGQLYTVEGDTNRAITPTGNFRVLRKIDGWRISRLGSLWRPAYFASGGFAIHGAPSVPPYPASHGCIRITISGMNRLYSMLPVGLPVHVYRT